MNIKISTHIERWKIVKFFEIVINGFRLVSATIKILSSCVSDSRYSGMWKWENGLTKPKQLMGYIRKHTHSVFQIKLVIHIVKRVIQLSPH